MVKQKKQLIIMLAVLIVAAAAFFALSKIPDEEDESTDSESYTLNDFAADEVTGLVITHSGETLTLEKDGEEWKCVEYSGTDIDEDSVKSLLERILPVTSENKIENVTDFAQYGLDNSTFKVELKSGENNGCTIEIGDYNEITSDYYCMVTEMDAASVFTLESSFVSALDITIDDITAAEEESGTTDASE